MGIRADATGTVMRGRLEHRLLLIEGLARSARLPDRRLAGESSAGGIWRNENESFLLGIANLEVRVFTLARSVMPVESRTRG